MFSSRGKTFLSSLPGVLFVLAGLFVFLFSGKQAAGQVSPSVSATIVNSTQGNGGWYISGVDSIISATASVGNISQIGYYYDSPPQNNIVFSGANPTESTETIFTVNGTHTLYYWAVDTMGNISATSSSTFKIDTVGPSPWSAWNAVQSGNDHSFNFSVNIKDLTSGIDPATAQFQYRTSAGGPWGVFPDISKCSGTFASGSSDPANYSGGQLTTPTIDFCDSDWGSCNKAVKVTISDLAGNQSSATYCLNSPWLETVNGDAHAETGYSVTPPPTGSYSSTGIVSYGSGIDSGFSSQNSWYLSSYSMSSLLPSYSSLFDSRGSGAQPLPGGQLPLQSGTYLVNSDFTVDNTTVPKSLSTTNNLGALIFVNGDLTVNTDLVLPDSSGLVFVVSGNINIANQANNLYGVFMSSGIINVAYNGEGEGGNKTMNIFGGLAAANGYSFNKELNGEENLTTPAVIITLMPGYFFNSALLSQFQGGSKYTWSEIAPQ